VTADVLRVLLVEDSEDDALLVVRELRRAGWRVEVERVETAEAMEAALTTRAWDVVLADYNLPHFSAPAALQLLGRKGLDLPFIIVSGAVGEEAAVAVMKAGAHDYVMKGALGRLAPAIQRELREAEDRRALARERAFSTLLVEGANALIIALDLSGRVTAFNRAAERLTGHRREDVLGRDWFDAMVPEGRRPELRAICEAFLATGTPVEHEGAVLTADGQPRAITWRCSHVRADDAVVGMIAFGIDVTDRIYAEAAREVLAQAARRAEKLAALGTLAAGLAHELNNPIGIMSSRIELMLLEGAAGLPEDVREDLQVLHRHAQRVARITQGLLSFAHRSAGERVPVDLNHIVREMLLLVERQIAKAGVRLSVDLAPDLPAVLGDADTLQQVVLNLVTNARDALGDRGDIEIVTRSPEPSVVELVVADTGPGIAPEDLGRLFDPFFTTKPNGTGLGLSITHGIVTEHRGTIDVESSPGQGTRFILTFPALVSQL
jgi:two-component system cell cycle sensor histidine kinase/response regulator CckA